MRREADEGRVSTGGRKSIWTLYAAFGENPVLTPEGWMQDATRINEAKPPAYDWAGELIGIVVAAVVTASMVSECIWWTRSELGK